MDHPGQRQRDTGFWAESATDVPVSLPESRTASELSETVKRVNFMLVNRVLMEDVKLNRT